MTLLEIASTELSRAMHKMCDGVPHFSHYMSSIAYSLLPEYLLDDSTTTQHIIHETSWLDGLRGVAAFLVVLQHEHSMINMSHHQCYHSPDTTSPAAWPILRLLFSGGSFAVVLFFVISGYVVPRRLIRLLHEGRQSEFIEALTSAVIRRHGRLLMPAMLSGLLIILFFWTTGFETNWGREKAPNIFIELWWWLLDCLQMLNYWTEFKSLYNGVTWTIFVELRGSMAIFGWLFATHILRPKWRILFTLVLIVFLVVFSLHPSFAAFFAGMLTCEIDLLHAAGELDQVWLPWTSLLRHLKEHRLARSALLHSGLVVGLLFASTPALKTDHSVSLEAAIARCSSWPSTLFNVVPPQYWDKWPQNSLAYRDFWYFWGAWLLAVSMKEIRWAKAVFEMKFPQYLGRHSFALYLTHLTVGATFSRVILILVGYGLLGGPNANWPYNCIPIGAWAHIFPPTIGPSGFQPGMLLDLALSLPLMCFVAEVGTKIFDRPSVTMSAWMWGQYQKLR